MAILAKQSLGMAVARDGNKDLMKKASDLMKKLTDEWKIYRIGVQGKGLRLLSCSKTKCIFLAFVVITILKGLMSEEKKLSNKHFKEFAEAARSQISCRWWYIFKQFFNQLPSTLITRISK